MGLDWSNIGNSAITGGLQAAGNGLIGLAGSALSYRYNKKLMQLQNKYAIDAFNRENARQDYLLSNQASIYKQSLKNAGLSSALAGIDGGASMASVNTQDTPSNPGSGQIDLGKFDLMQTRLMEAQAKNIEADTNKKVAETEGQSIQNYLNTTYGDAQWQAAIKNLDSQTAQNYANELYLNQKKLNETNLTETQINSIEKHLDWDYQKLGPELQLLCAQAYQATASGDLNHAQVSEVWQSIRESAQRISNLQTELGLTSAQTAVAVQQAKNFATENKILGLQAVSQKAHTELDQFRKDVEKSMGLRFYQAKRVAEAVLPIGVIGTFLGKAVGSAVTPGPVVVKGFRK